ncbi:MAG: bifunctional methylenetetrahydrofolate dehydrogenase/methenyltetrahydrofolate cyclohydrolase, partial [bacterium]|nr:bifunctional methylenetetrahydrofolate dehydrogenase/methenyltetrahydrofolate cyclohydrolase [bacterium]
MKIDGREIAQEILDSLQKTIAPHLAIILVGDDPASKAYIGQKELKTKEIGAKTTTLNLSSNVSSEQLLKTIEQFNNDNNIHGIIVQRPLPAHIDDEAVTLAIDPKKDIDGLRPDSPYPMPIAEAVLKILSHLGWWQADPEQSRRRSHDSSEVNFISWLKTKHAVVIGKGKTGGGPVIEALKKLGT